MIHICSVTNDIFSRYCQSFVYEIIAHKNPDTELFIHILIDKLSNKNDFDIFKDIPKVSFELIDVRDKKTVDKNIKYNTRRNCLEPFDRYLIPELQELQNVDRVLYLDADIVVKKDLTELYNSELNGNMLGAIQNTWHMSRSFFHHDFVNAGVILIDMDLARKQRFTRKCISNTTSADLNDELVINYVFKYQTQHLPIKYNLLYARVLNGYPYFRDIDLYNKYYKTNYSSIQELIKDAVVIHMAGNKFGKDFDYPAFHRFYKYYFDRLDNFKKTKEIINDRENELNMLLDLP